MSTRVSRLGRIFCAVAIVLAGVAGCASSDPGPAPADAAVVAQDQTSGALHDWVLGSGFTREEIALIQEPYIREQPQNPDFAQTEDARLRAHFAETIAQLQSSTEASLDLAVKRALDENVPLGAA